MPRNVLLLDILIVVIKWNIIRSVRSPPVLRKNVNSMWALVKQLKLCIRQVSYFIFLNKAWVFSKLTSIWSLYVYLCLPLILRQKGDENKQLGNALHNLTLGNYYYNFCFVFNYIFYFIYLIFCCLKLAFIFIILLTTSFDL